MEIKFHGSGFMKKYLKEDLYSIILPDGATMDDWYEAFHFEYAELLTSTVWNAQKKRFYRPVKVTINGEKKKVPDDYVLSENDLIKISMIIVGG